MTESVSTPPVRDICALPPDQLTPSERRTLITEAEQFLVASIPQRNQPGVEESTAVSISPYASSEVKSLAEKIRELETDRLLKARAWFNRKNQQSMSFEQILGARTDRLLEMIIVMLGLQHGDGTIDFRLFGDPKETGFDLYLAHEGIDQGAKTDAIATVGKLVLRIDAATGTTIPKMAQNFIAMRELGTMGPMQTVTISPLDGPKFRGADVNNAPRFIVALSRPTVLRLAQKFVRLARAVKESASRSEIARLEEDIEMDEANLWIIEQMAIQAETYAAQADAFRSEALARQEQLEAAIASGAYATDPAAKDAAEKEIERIRGNGKKEGYVQRISDMKLSLRRAFEQLQTAYQKKHDEIVADRERRGLPPLGSIKVDDISHRRFMHILETPRHLTRVAALTPAQIKRKR